MGVQLTAIFSSSPLTFEGARGRAKCLVSRVLAVGTEVAEIAHRNALGRIGVAFEVSCSVVADLSRAAGIRSGRREYDRGKLLERIENA